MERQVFRYGVGVWEIPDWVTQAFIDKQLWYSNAIIPSSLSMTDSQGNNYTIEQGDYIMKDASGNLYTCKPDVFDALYSKVADEADPVIDGNTSDGYHTFDELYHHRAVLFSVICGDHPEKAWKSKKHADGTMYDGMFIVGINTPEGPATYHYDIDLYWDMFPVTEFDMAPEWDGHTSEEAIRRIGLLRCVY